MKGDPEGEGIKKGLGFRVYEGGGGGGGGLLRYVGTMERIYRIGESDEESLLGVPTYTPRSVDL